MPSCVLGRGTTTGWPSRLAVSLHASDLGRKPLIDPAMLADRTVHAVTSIAPAWQRTIWVHRPPSKQGHVVSGLGLPLAGGGPIPGGEPSGTRW